MVDVFVDRMKEMTSKLAESAEISLESETIRVVGEENSHIRQTVDHKSDKDAMNGNSNQTITSSVGSFTSTVDSSDDRNSTESLQEIPSGYIPDTSSDDLIAGGSSHSRDNFSPQMTSTPTGNGQNSTEMNSKDKDGSTESQFVDNVFNNMEDHRKLYKHSVINNDDSSHGTFLDGRYESSMEEAGLSDHKFSSDSKHKGSGSILSAKHKDLQTVSKLSNSGSKVSFDNNVTLYAFSKKSKNPQFSTERLKKFSAMANEMFHAKPSSNFSTPLAPSHGMPQDPSVTMISSRHQSGPMSHLVPDTEQARRKSCPADKIHVFDQVCQNKNDDDQNREHVSTVVYDTDETIDTKLLNETTVCYDEAPKVEQPSDITFDYTTPSKLLRKRDDREKNEEVCNAAQSNGITFDYTTPSKLLTKQHNRERNEAAMTCQSVVSYTTPSKLLEISKERDKVDSRSVKEKPQVLPRSAGIADALAAKKYHSFTSSQDASLQSVPPSLKSKRSADSDSALLSQAKFRKTSEVEGGEEKAKSLNDDKTSKSTKQHGRFTITTANDQSHLVEQGKDTDIVNEILSSSQIDLAEEVQRFYDPSTGMPFKDSLPKAIVPNEVIKQRQRDKMADYCENPAVGSSDVKARLYLKSEDEEGHISDSGSSYIEIMSLGGSDQESSADTAQQRPHQARRHTAPEYILDDSLFLMRRCMSDASGMLPVGMTQPSPESDRKNEECVYDREKVFHKYAYNMKDRTDTSLPSCLPPHSIAASFSSSCGCHHTQGSGPGSLASPRGRVHTPDPDKVRH